MMMHRDIYNKLGGWPEEFGIYGGGENFINFTLAVMGMQKWVFTSKPLYHYAAPRGYHWNYMDYHRNRTIATYMFGDEDLAERYIMNIKGDDAVAKRKVFYDVIEKCRAHRDFLEDKKVVNIWDWVDLQG
jgi:hypothetical protein